MVYKGNRSQLGKKLLEDLVWNNSNEIHFIHKDNMYLFVVILTKVLSSEEIISLQSYALWLL